MRRVETAESFAGSRLVLPEAVREQIASQQVEILAVGVPDICEDEDCERLHGYTPQRPASIFPGASAQGARRHDDQWGATRNPDPTNPECLWFHAFHGKAGDWVLVAPRSLVECGDPTGKTFLVRQDDVIAVLNAV